MATYLATSEWLLKNSVITICEVNVEGNICIIICLDLVQVLFFEVAQQTYIDA